MTVNSMFIPEPCPLQSVRKIRDPNNYSHVHVFGYKACDVCAEGKEISIRLTFVGDIKCIQCHGNNTAHCKRQVSREDDGYEFHITCHDCQCST